MWFIEAVDCHDVIIKNICLEWSSKILRILGNRKNTILYTYFSRYLEGNEKIGD